MSEICDPVYLTQQALRKELQYNPETGKFLWLLHRKGRRGTVGTVNKHGYLVITMSGRRIMAHRLAWFYMTGVWPAEELDHIDRDTSNNKFNNLREASHSENSVNSKIREDNSSGHPGICWDRQKMKWKVQISSSGNKRIQKHFYDFDQAVRFYKETAASLFKEFDPQHS